MISDNKHLCRQLFALTSILVFLPAVRGQEIDPEVIELEPFVVYAGLIDLVDGHTGKPYRGDHPVVREFSREFNRLLLGYHRQLLREEYAFLVNQVKLGLAFHRRLSELGGTFGIGPVELDKDRYLRIEKAIFHRLLKDPFFRIEALVVWDLDRLERAGGQRPGGKYGRDIRYNEAAGRWERRVLTRWEANVRVKWRNGTGGFLEIVKEQGLNLDTNEGFHFINRGLTGFVAPEDFADVRLTYPIFVTAQRTPHEQLEELRTTLLENLTYIYDPFSWAWRRNERYRANESLLNRFKNEVQAERFKVTDREWFEPLLAQFLHDIVTTELQGVDEIYNWEMLQKVPVNRNVLGRNLDLLNWNPGEARSVPYDPEQQGGVWVDFEKLPGARFILLDAYRRFPDAFVTALRRKLTNLEMRVSGKELIKETLAEVSGMPADVYIREVSRIQKAELEKRRLVLNPEVSGNP